MAEMHNADTPLFCNKTAPFRSEPIACARTEATGGELVPNPHGSVRFPVCRLNCSAGVVILAWDARDALTQCLLAIEQCSVNREGAIGREYRQAVASYPLRPKLASQGQPDRRRQIAAELR